MPRLSELSIIACTLQGMLYDGFLTKGPLHDGGVDGFFADVSEPVYILKGALYNVQTLILDAVVIYRAHVVWKNFWILLFPVLGWFGLLASCVGLNYAFATTPPDTDDVFSHHTGGWVISVYAMTLATNVTATTLLAYRIWRVNRRAAEFVASDRLSIVLHVVIESGLIYSVFITAALLTFVAGSNTVYVLLDILSPIISIVFNMIIVRVGLTAGSTGLTVIGVESDRHHADLEFAATNPGTHHVRRDTGVELKSMTVDLTGIRDSDAHSAVDIDTKTGTLGPASSESAPRHLSRVASL
ncbi:hypothetical protein EUX98_g4556 [Antrodiella citrinella]|uniref:Uncharacterized protein n=1 Tax=Antrodiella citrinella TaxID=2447956 RepID=A0A4S4MTP5_9APHY|nr:hypothetical protein EUX98_g4556 [Antrodiella citrinella]